MMKKKDGVEQPQGCGRSRSRGLAANLHTDT